jgi:molybdopterin molybdotransferase
MLEYEEAAERILAAVPPSVPEAIPIADACGRILREKILSAGDVPPFDNSAMDGYAVRASDVAGARPDAPARLRLLGRVAAGQTFLGELTAGSCVRLFTGSPLPHGADAVVMQEDTKVLMDAPAEVLFFDGAKPWEHVRLQGEDVRKGMTLAEAGEPLTAGLLALLLATGCSVVNAGRRPVIGLLATGNELVEPGTPLAAGQIYESNRLMLAPLIQRAGAVAKIFPLVADSLDATMLAFQKAFDQCDAVISSGGVSVGEMDFVKAAFEQLGGTLDFWKVAIRPGRPFAFGLLPFTEGAKGAKLLFGLPGNPVSALVTFLLLVRPALLRWQGATHVHLPTHPGILAEPLSNEGERRHFLRVQSLPDGSVRPAGVQASHVLSAVARANGLVDLQPRTTLPAGTQVRVMSWE